MITSKESAQLIAEATPAACEEINKFSRTVLRTRGGRLGSGMGSLLEALWGYYINKTLLNEGGEAAACEVAWLDDHEYNDFACIHRDQEWIKSKRQGELLRIEAKSMNTGADESKGHFDEIDGHLNSWDLLLVLVWSWDPCDKYRVYPHIRDHFIGPAKQVANLRDVLHLARGGTFVIQGNCPDKCSLKKCPHIGEPLNAAGKRERNTGPSSRRPSQNVSFAANFGGLVRMLKTDSENARAELRTIRKKSNVAHQYVSFIHRNFPKEERNQYKTSEWVSVAKSSGVDPGNLTKDELIEEIRKSVKKYQDKLRKLPS